jgi:hypothetical protein
LFLLAVLALNADAQSAFLPKRNTLKKFHGRGGTILPRGPRYEAAETRSSDARVEQIRASAPGVNDVAAQSAGWQATSGSCVHSARDRINAITAELQAIQAKVQQYYNNELACGLNSACASYWAEQAVAEAFKALQLGKEAAALSYQAEAEELACRTVQGGFGQPVRPAGLTYQALAQRFNIALEDAVPSYAGASREPLHGFGSAALEQFLSGLDQDGMLNEGGRGLGPIARDYAGVAGAAGVLAGRIQAGKDLAGKRARDFDDPDQAAQDEYLRINYEELGPKYAALAQERRRKADTLADKVLAAAPALPLPLDEPPIWRTPETAEDGGESLLAKLKQGLAEEAQDRFEDWLSEGLGMREKALIGIAKIDKSVFEGVNEMAAALPKAVAELGSATLEHPNIDRLQNRLDDFYREVQKVSSEQLSAITGLPSNPEDAMKSGLRSFFDRVLGVGE